MSQKNFTSYGDMETLLTEVVSKCGSSVGVGVEELIRDTVGRTGKNLLVYPYYEGTEEEKDVTFTDNGDGTITLNGTSSGSAYHFLERNSSLYLKAGNYILSGGVLNAWLYLYTNDGTEITHTNNSDMSVRVRISSDGYYRVSLVISANKTFSNVTCYPMLRHAEIVDDTYEVYHKPIEDEMLTQAITMPTASATYAGKVVQYVGTSDLTYTHGRFYECVENNGVYSWQTISVQALSDHYSGLAIYDIGYAFSLAGARSMYSELKSDATDQYKRTLTAGTTRVVIDGFNLDSQMVEGKYGTNCEYLIVEINTSKDGLGTTDVIVSKADPETHIMSTTYSIYVYFPEQSEDVDILIVLRKAKV